MPWLPALSGSRLTYDAMWHSRHHYRTDSPGLPARDDRLHRSGRLLKCFGAYCLTFAARHVCRHVAVTALLLRALSAVGQMVLDHAGISDRDRAVACRVGPSFALRRSYREL